MYLLSGSLRRAAIRARDCSSPRNMARNSTSHLIVYLLAESASSVAFFATSSRKQSVDSPWLGQQDRIQTALVPVVGQ